jgi:peptide/nickel transport system permease protein
MKSGSRAPFYLAAAWIFLAALALGAPFLAGDHPLMVLKSRGISFPLLEKRLISWGLMSGSTTDFTNSGAGTKDTLFVLWPLVPYEPLQPDYSALLKAPFTESSASRKSHLLGTDALGRDLLAGLLHATHHTLFLAVTVMAIAFTLGTLLGTSAGYFGNTGLRLPWWVWISAPFYWFLGWFWSFPARETLLHHASEQGSRMFLGHALFSLMLWLALSLILTYSTHLVMHRIFPKAPGIPVPLDDIVMKIMEALSALPRLLIVLALVPVFQPGWVGVVAILGSLSWTGIARLWRSGILTHKNRDYMLAARALGLPTQRLIWHHLIPNTMGPVAVAVANGLAGVVLTEAALSFLGFGLPQETLTWGRLLMNARFYPEAWWLTLFPALCLTGFIALCHETLRFLKRTHPSA